MSAPKGGSKAKRPAAVAERKQESRHQQWWYPKRCEREGCEVTDDLQKCAACCMVMYCCREHQKDDWPLHKAECKVFRRVGARATFYDDATQLARFPLQPSMRDCEDRTDRPEPVPRGCVCELCNKKDSEVHMTRTCCCNQIVCDTSHNYQMMSYSRDFCERSHERYTLCGYHGVEKECERGKDWRECKGCLPKYRDDASGVADALWRGLNPYNYTPLLSKDVPRHSLCDTCSQCGAKFISGVEGASFGGGGITCISCMGPMMSGIPQGLHFAMDGLSV